MPRKQYDHRLSSNFELAACTNISFFCLESCRIKKKNFAPTRKLLLIEDRGPADNVLTLTLDLQSRESYGHDLYSSKRSRAKVTRFKS